MMDESNLLHVTKMCKIVEISLTKIYLIYNIKGEETYETRHPIVKSTYMIEGWNPSVRNFDSSRHIWEHSGQWLAENGCLYKLANKTWNKWSFVKF